MSTPSRDAGVVRGDEDLKKFLAFQEIFHDMAVERLRALLTPEVETSEPERPSRQQPATYLAPASSDVYTLPVRVLPAAIEFPEPILHPEFRRREKVQPDYSPELRRLARDNYELKFRLKSLAEKSEEIIRENQWAGEEIKRALALCSEASTNIPRISDGPVGQQEKAAQTTLDLMRIENDKAEAVGKVAEAVRLAHEAEVRCKHLQRELDSARVLIEDLKTKAAFSTEVQNRLTGLSTEFREEKKRRLEAEAKLEQSNAKLEETRTSSERMESDLRKEISKLIQAKVRLESQVDAQVYDASRAEKDYEAKISRQQVEIDALRDRAEKMSHQWRLERDKGLSLAQALSDCRQQVEILQRYQPRVEPRRSITLDEVQLQNQHLLALVEAKNYETTAELEKLVTKQADILRRLKDECQVLTKRLDEAHKAYKTETSRLNEENDILTSRLRDITSLWDSMLTESDLQARIQRLSGVVGDLKAGLRMAPGAKEASEEE